MAAAAPERELVACHDCAQLLAWRSPAGAIRVVGGETIVEPDGRVRITCPRCGNVIRLRPGPRTQR
jgi:hypothetical protein